ncbi:hypothetical protein [Streptomyces sp. NPDC056061]|uniref:hypothetical protein n=1 Tax=Streptomyces sp. NPDC056061 TaxID=3345700 RepID=UPI0035DF0DE4
MTMTHFRWAVMYPGHCLSADDTWDFEPQPSSCDEDFLRRLRLSRDGALRLAAQTADHVKFNGRTFAQWAER